MRMHCCAAFVLALTLGLAGCGPGGEESAPDPVAAVRVSAAVVRDFDNRITVYGIVELATARSETLSVQSESQVAELYVIQGASVRKGDRLLRLVGSANARLDAEKAARDAIAARNEAARVERLHAQGLANNSELEAARGAAATAEALSASLTARTGHAGGVTLTAPRSGIVESLTARPGDIIAPGAIAVRIADPSAWQVRLGIEPDDVKRLHTGQSVSLSGLSDSRSTAGAIKYVDERIDPQSHLASAFVTGRESLPLPPGAGLRGVITLMTHPHAVSVPRMSVLYEDEKPIIFVALKDKAQRREVETGFQDDNDVEILKGIAAGDAVVVLGNDELSDGMAIRIESASGQATP